MEEVTQPDGSVVNTTRVIRTPRGDFVSDEIEYLDGYIRASCVYETTAGVTQQGKHADVFTDLFNSTNIVPYGLPWMSTTQDIIPITSTCYVESQCQYTLQFSDELAHRAPLLKITMSLPHLYKLSTNNVCILQQLDQYSIHLFVVQRARLDPAKPNSCTLLYTPEIATVWGQGITEDTYHQTPQHLSAKIEVSDLQDGEFTPEQLDALLKEVFVAPVVFEPARFKPPFLMETYNVPFNPIMAFNQTYMTVVTTPGCQAALVCELQMQFHSPIGLAKIKTTNYLRYDDFSTKYECWDATTLVGWLSHDTDSTLKYMYFVPAALPRAKGLPGDYLGFQFGSCSVMYRPRFDKPRAWVKHWPILARTDAYPYLDQYAPENIGEEQYNAVDDIFIPYTSPHSTAPWGWFSSPNTKNNYFTFRITEADDEFPTSTTVAVLRFRNVKTGRHVFESGNIFCHIPNDVANKILDIGPSQCKCRSLVGIMPQIQSITWRATSKRVTPSHRKLSPVISPRSWGLICPGMMTWHQH